MVPSKSTRNSLRRSSILKTPKARQPLQNLNFNSSSNENSPTITSKIKRRVSFAEKKHVKEFCNSLEQGTVWDNTYEEHDISNLKIPCSNQEECVPENVYKENIFCSTNENDIQSVCNTIIRKNYNVEDCNLYHMNAIEDLNYQDKILSELSVPCHGGTAQGNESTSLTDLQLKDDNYISKDIVVYEDLGRKLDEKVSEVLKPNINNFDDNKLNTTSIQDTCMDFTEIVGNIVCFDANFIQGNNVKEISKNPSTQLIQNVLLSKSKESFHQFDKSNVEETNVTNQDVLMELTLALPSIIKYDGNSDNAETGMCFIDDRTKGFDNISMEMTATIPSSLYNLQPNNNSINYCIPNLMLSDNDNKTIVFHDMTMNITKAVETTVYRSSDKSIVIQKSQHSEYNITKQDEKTELINTSMEMTKAISNNMHSAIEIHEESANNFDIIENSVKKLRPDSDVCETSTNHNRTRICNDETMEFTTAATTLSAEHQNNFQMPIRSTFYIQPNSSNSVFNNDRSHSNRTIIFHDNSMTITNVLSSLDTRHNCTKVIADCESNINQNNEAIRTTQFQAGIDTGSSEVRQSVLLDNIENRNVTDFSIYSNNATKDICTNASAAISCSLNSDTILSKENYIINNSSKAIENNAMEKSTPIKVQSSANVKPSMALHESEQQDAFASALKENNTEIACATLNSVLNDSSSSANLELNKDKNVVDKYTETIISHPRRTYTICSLSNDRTFTVDNKKNNNISEINNDILYKLNDEEHNAHNIFNNTENLQNEEDYDRQHLMDKSDIFSNKSLEDLESIKPPSFCCSDNFSDLSMNIIHNQEINTEANYLLKYENREQEGTQKIENCKANVLEEIVRESRTFLIKRVCLYNAPDSLRFEQENQTQNGKIQKLDLLNKKDTDTEIQVLACLSSSVSDTDKFSMVSNANLQNLDNSNLENKNIKYSSPNTSVIDENTSKVDDYNKLLDTNMVEANNESYSNEKLRLSLEPRTSYVEENITTELDTFCLLMDELKIRAKSNETIWEVYHENIERNMFVIGFISCSLLVIIFVQNSSDETNDRFIKEIKIISRLADDADVLISIVHRVILEKLDIKRLLDLYKDYNDILLMLDYISKEVKLAMDFMFDLKRLSDLNLMEITRDRVSFISQTKMKNIILKITIDIKPFDRIESQNISVHCLLGFVREEEVKKLITNIKRDYKFLRRYMNDVKDYIYLMESSNTVI
ncbi:PREDICTED: probable cyclin-dependent serine/threonine-protein kinase DDB_G0292550 [Eufriesea mexicana]|uniref:probable cyclin-dependent serine/threonine-protein kinase DDB_G0292550 n=1 Tax=Eufriesea mexicana TaxID=516756 RepID=UPI00083BEFF6|nr:PREDICTED: probable cyclin-dependent serine/threonine-protein kinase DDB_G0292550 [Eufriesea mexicana]